MSEKSGPIADEELVRRAKTARHADLRAFDQLVMRHQGEILANCRFIGGSTDEAEDLAQEVFIKAYHGLGGFREHSRFRTWLQRIKVNHCLNHLRKKRGKVFVDVEDADVALDPAMRTDPDDSAGEKLRDAKINAVLEALPDTLRVPLVLADVDEFTYEEISQFLGLGLSATKMRIKRARAAFRAGLGAPRRSVASKSEATAP